MPSFSNSYLYMDKWVHISPTKHQEQPQSVSIHLFNKIKIISVKQTLKTVFMEFENLTIND